MHSTLARTHYLTALVLAVGMAVTVGTALGFEHLGGYIPCKLCLMQRQPYYWGIPVAIVAMSAVRANASPLVTRGLIGIVLILMLVGAGMGVYHSGVEWHFWEGPASCATSANGVTTDAGDLLSDLNTVKGPSCTEAALRVLGLSFAGWNVLASLALAAIAARAVFRKA